MMKVVDKLTNRIIREKSEKECLRKLKEIYKDLHIRRGPFKNMRYSTFASTGSTLFPKLIGIYEHEIADIFEEAKKQHYEFFIDVGCAEGYYAVGMAKFGNAERVIAYDIDDYAKQLCGEMASINQVQVEIRHELTAEELQNYPFDKAKRSFIMVDCEGFERKLFTNDNIKNLQNVECLIEIHDWCQYEKRTREILLNMFKDTHECKIIEGIDDYDKAYDYKIEELMSFSIKERFKIFAEKRRRIGAWLYCVPKKYNE